MYLTNCYVRINGKMYMRGEKIPADTPKEKLEWLLKANAIKEVTIASQPQDTAEKPENPKEEPVEIPEEPEEDAAESETEDEADEEAEAPEIDVMAGIVQGETKEKPEKKTTRKQTGRRKNG